MPLFLAYPDPAVVRAVRDAKIPIRIGTGRRFLTIRMLTHRVWQSRKRSGKHENVAWIASAVSVALNAGLVEAWIDRPRRPQRMVSFVQMERCAMGVGETRDNRGVNMARIGPTLCHHAPGIRW